MTVTGERIYLADMDRAQYHALRRIYVPDPMMDPDPYTYDADATDARYGELLAKADTSPRYGIYLPGGEIIGSIAIKDIDLEKRRCELGIFLAHDGFKEQGYGREAFALALSYAFDTMGMARVHANTMGSNVRMQRVLDRLGFRCFLRLEDCYRMGDRWEDRLDYVIERETYLAAPS